MAPHSRFKSLKSIADTIPQAATRAPISSLPLAQPVRSNNPFEAALAKHLSKLKPEERLVFAHAYDTSSPEALLARVRQFDERHGSGVGPVQRHAPTISKCFAIVDQLIRSMTIVIQSNPEISALAIGGLRFLIDVAVKYATFFPKLSSMISHLARYLEVLSSFVECSQKDQASEKDLIYRATANLYGDWLDFCTAARSVFLDKHGKPRRWISIRTFLRVQWDPFEATFSDIDKNFQRDLGVLMHSSLATQYNEVRTLALVLQRDRKEQSEKEDSWTRKEFMAWIANLDYEDDHDRISTKKHPGTCDWFLQREDFQFWLNSPSSQLLWCHGRPGSGKTVLASHALETITSRAGLNDCIGIAFCYFNYKQAELQRPRDMLSAFVKQLCWKRPNLPPRILEFYKKHVMDARVPSFAVVQNAVITLADEFDEVYLIVDALDECEQSLREQMLGAVVEVARSHPCVKAFVTSRRETDIEQMFSALETPTVVIKASYTANDIRKYVTDTVTELEATRKLRIQESSTKEIIINTLVDNADGMFLWVFLQIQSLRRERRDVDILRALKNLPQDLYETYRRVLDIIEALPSTLQALAQQSLTLVFFAARPLRMTELIDLAAVVSGFDEMQRHDLYQNRYCSQDILEACSNLLIEDEGIVRPSHFSVQEYFSSPRTIEGDPRLSKYFMTPAEGNAQIATACLRYLCFHFLRGGPCGSEFSLAARLDRYPCSRYAAQYFDHHLAVLPSVPLDIEHRLDAFLSQPDRCLASFLQLRRLKYGPHDGLLHNEFDNLPWPANAGTVIGSTKLYSLPVKSDCPCWDVPPLPQVLHQACYDGMLEAVQHLLASGHDPLTIDSRNKTPLYYSARGGHPEICRLLLSVRFAGFESALKAAFQQGHEAVVRVLLLFAEKENFQWSGQVAQQTIAFIAFRGSKQMLRLLVSTQTVQGGSSAINWASGIQAAAAPGHLPIIEELCKMKASIRFWINARWCGSALHIACYKGNSRLVAFLLSESADPNLTFEAADLALPREMYDGCQISVAGNTPLWIAAQQCFPNVVRLLLEAGANPNEISNNRTILDVITASGFQPSDQQVNRSVVDMLLEFGARYRGQLVSTIGNHKRKISSNHATNDDVDTEKAYTEYVDRILEEEHRSMSIEKYIEVTNTTDVSGLEHRSSDEAENTSSDENEMYGYCKIWR